MAKDLLTTLLIAGGAAYLGYAYGGSPKEQLKVTTLKSKAASLQKDISSNETKLDSLKTEVSKWADIKDAEESRQNYISEKELAEKEYDSAKIALDEVEKALDRTKEQLSNAINKLDPRYEQKLLNDISELKEEKEKLLHRIDALKGEVRSSKKTAEYYRNLYWNK